MASATSSRLDWAATQRTRLAAVGASTWAMLALGAVCALALAAYLAFPTYPTYDSLYALLWGRDLLHLQSPGLHVYRAPTEHPLALAFGALCSLFGQDGARLLVLGSVASFVALLVGSYRLARLCFGQAVAVVAVLLLLSRFFVEDLALQGYLDVTYAALVVWAAALEAARPRRGLPVFALLCAAGLLRPEAWLLSGAYCLWCAWGAQSRGSHPLSHGSRPASHGSRPPPWHCSVSPSCGLRSPLRMSPAQLGLAALAPVLWMGFDALLSGDPLYSLRSTAGLAQRLGRAQSFTGVLSSTWTYAVRIDKLPVVLGAIGGALAALRVASRRAVLPLALLGCLLAAFVIEGAAGASVLDRYMVAAGIALLPFCALALGGWSLLPRGALARRAWMGAAVALLVFGVVQASSTLSLSQLRDTLTYHEQLDGGLHAALRSTAVEHSLRRCPLLSLPNNKLIPDALWMLSGEKRLGSAAHIEVLARSQARELAARGIPALRRRLQAGSVAVYPLAITHFFDAVAGIGEEPRPKQPPPGFRRIYASRSYAVYANC